MIKIYYKFQWLIIAFLAIVVALLVSGVLIFVLGYDPVIAYGAMLEGAVGSVYDFSVTCVRATPLLFIGLGFLIGYRAGIFNVGGDGQLYAGAIGALLIGLLPWNLPTIIHIPLGIAVGAIFGALWVLIPAYLRAYHDVNEIVTTLMFNYMGYYLAAYLINANDGPLFERGASFAQSKVIAESAQLPVLLNRTDLHLGIVIAIILAICVYLAINHTTWGFRLKIVGSSPKTARYMGIDAKREILIAMLIGGSFAGLAGASEIMGLRYRLFEGLSPGYGYDAIAVALLANANALGTIIASVFFGGLRAGSDLMQQTIGIDVSVIFIIQGLIIIFVIGALAYTNYSKKID
jgi:simple sugar transport system permease protein